MKPTEAGLWISGDIPTPSWHAFFVLSLGWATCPRILVPCLGGCPELGLEAGPAL